VKITVERCNEFLVALPQIFDRVKSGVLWSAKKKEEERRTIKGYGSAARFLGSEIVQVKFLVKNTSTEINH
jgi:hypothetical protein